MGTAAALVLWLGATAAAQTYPPNSGGIYQGPNYFHGYAPSSNGGIYRGPNYYHGYDIPRGSPGNFTFHGHSYGVSGGYAPLIAANTGYVPLGGPNAGYYYLGGNSSFYPSSVSGYGLLSNEPPGPAGMNSVQSLYYAPPVDLPYGRR
jgi:hypothetical protein